MGDTCTYLFRDKTSCMEPVPAGSGLCFWHDPETDKTGADIKRVLEEKHSMGEMLEGYMLKDSQLENAKLSRANLHNTNFSRANLKGAHLYGADLSNASLFKAVLDGANMKEAKLKDADILGASLDGAKLEFIDFGYGGECMVKNEIDGDALAKKGAIQQAKLKYSEAEDIYRTLKLNLKTRGLAFESGVYFFREMVMIRKQIPLYSLDRFWSKLMSVSTGYGEKPHRIIGFSVASMFIFAVIAGLIGMHHTSGRLHQLSLSAPLSENLLVFYDALYYSVVTFTTLGYGDFTPTGIGKMFAVLESFAGAFCISLFTISTYKRYMDR